jgi:hypothetical protein
MTYEARAWEDYNYGTSDNPPRGFQTEAPLYTAQLSPLEHTLGILNTRSLHADRTLDVADTNRRRIAAVCDGKLTPIKTIFGETQHRHVRYDADGLLVIRYRVSPPAMYEAVSPTETVHFRMATRISKIPQKQLRDLVEQHVVQGDTKRKYVTLESLNQYIARKAASL